MRIEADGVQVNGPHGVLLHPTTVLAGSGRLCLVEGPPGAGHTALSLLLGGRLRPDAGTVLADGEHQPQRLRERVALVDVPDVSEPDEVLKLSTIVGEELAMARRPASGAAVRAWLADADAADWHGTRVEDVPAELRLRLLTTLAALRPGIEALVVCVPDRYGTHADDAWRIVEPFTGRGLAVVLQLMETTARAISHDRFTLGVRHVEEPEVEPVEPEPEAVAEVEPEPAEVETTELPRVEPEEEDRA